MIEERDGEIELRVVLNDGSHGKHDSADGLEEYFSKAVTKDAQGIHCTSCLWSVLLNFAAGVCWLMLNDVETTTVWR